MPLGDQRFDAIGVLCRSVTGGKECRLDAFIVEEIEQKRHAFPDPPPGPQERRAIRFRVHRHVDNAALAVS